ncbi:MAG: hypothetical protein OXH05_07130 [Acidobacteria bacterium]|nr:hypothetical protein [Acidobacteriota bacterium]
MKSGLAAVIRTALIPAGLMVLAGCTGSSPGTPAPAPAPPPGPPPPPAEPVAVCGVSSLRVDVLGQGGATGIVRAELTLEAEDPGVGLEFASPYTVQVPDGGANLDIPGLRPTIGVFVSDLAFMPLGAGFRQTMTIEWISELEIRAGGPGCEPVSVSCDLGGCGGS